MKMKTMLRATPLLCLLLAPLAYAADDAKAEPPEQEVIIEATRANLVKLGKQIKDAEWRFYKRYNDFNTKRQYAINCNEETRGDSHFKRSVCEPRYQSDAEAEEAQNFYRMLMQAGPSNGYGPMSETAAKSLPPGQGAGMGGGTPAALITAAGRSDFQKHVLEVTQAHPELQKMLEEHGKMWEQYKSLFYRVNGRALGGTEAVVTK
jgi:hypothetical protein